MTWTAKQISDLDNSMVAAQNVNLGTVLGALVGTSSVASGSFTPSAATSSVNTGLSDVIAVTCSLNGSPTLNHTWTTATAGSAGWINVYCWKPTNASTVTAIAATGSYVAVNWIAVGAQ